LKTAMPACSCMCTWTMVWNFHSSDTLRIAPMFLPHFWHGITSEWDPNISNNSQWTSYKHACMYTHAYIHT
jgi:hypothetical protein